MRRTAIALTLCLVLGIGKTVSQDKPKEMSRTYNEAVNFAEARDFKQAIPMFQRILKTEASLPQVYYYLGYCYLNTSEGPDTAITYFEKGLLALPKTDNLTQLGVDMQYSLAKAYHLTNNTKIATQNYEKLLAVLPENATELRAQIARDIEMCQNLDKALLKPVGMQSTNAGKIINSKYDDHSPLVSADGSMLFFTTRRPSSYNNLMPDGQYSEKIYFSSRNEKTGEWGKPAIINKLFNRDGHESCVSLSADGTELYLFRNDMDGKNLYVCQYDGSSWAEPVKLPEPINSGYNETHLTLTPDKSTAYFTSDRPGGLGGIDIYEVRRLPNGEWAKPKNMGPEINTPFDEETPMLHPDGKTLYFSSEGHNSIGGLDIFVSRLQDDGTWSSPTNMGYPINTPDDDFFFVPTASYNQAWYASAKFKDTFGAHDIYMIQYDEAEESRVAVLKGEVNSSEDNPLENVQITVQEKGTNNLIGQYKPHPGSGKYIIIAERGKIYELTYSGEGFIPVTKEVTVSNDMTYAKIQKGFSLENVQLVAVNPPVQPTSATIAGTEAASGTPQVVLVNDGIPYYTVQILTRKGPVASWEKAFKGLEAEMIKEYKCKNNMYRYAYGQYKGFKSATRAKEKILKASAFQDSFIRNISQYDELIEKE